MDCPYKGSTIHKEFNVMVSLLKKHVLINAVTVKEGFQFYLPIETIDGGVYVV